MKKGIRDEDKVIRNAKKALRNVDKVIRNTKKALRNVDKAFRNMKNDIRNLLFIKTLKPPPLVVVMYNWQCLKNINFVT